MIRALLKFLGRRGADDPEGVLAPAAFAKALERECVRADRTGRPVSLVLIRKVPPAAPPKRGPDALQRAAGVLVGRVRCTDVVGRPEHGGLGLILSDTTPEGAWRVVDRLKAQVGELAGDDMACEVRTYPFAEARGHA